MMRNSEEIRDNKPGEDMLLKQAFSELESPRIPMGFVDKLTRKFEMRTVRRRLWQEWVYKMAVIIGIIVGFVVILYFVEKDFTIQFKFEYILPILGLLMLSIVFFFDQVILKWMFYINKQRRDQSL